MSYVTTQSRRGGSIERHQQALRARAVGLCDNPRFVQALARARDDWNARNESKLGGLLKPLELFRGPLVPAGMTDADAAATREWIALVDRLTHDFFPGYPLGLAHPARDWMAACLIAKDEHMVPRGWIVVEPPMPRFDHPYPAELERIILEAIWELQRVGVGDIAQHMVERLRHAQQVVRFAWPFVPHIDNSTESRLSRARDMRTAGATHRDIASTLGVSQRQVQRWEAAGYSTRRRQRT